MNSNYFDKLQAKLQESSRAAMLETAVEDPEQTIGDIIQSFQSNREDSVKYLYDEFCSTTIRDFFAAYRLFHDKPAPPAQPVAPAEPAPAVTIEPERAAPKPEKGTVAPKAPKNKPPVQPKKKAAKLNLRDPAVAHQYRIDTLAFLIENNHTEEDLAVAGAAIIDKLGGTPTQLRKILNDLIDDGVVSYTGRARGTRYYSNK